MSSLYVNEIFSTIQGEAKFTGYPTTFVRLYGCNMLCKYCDTLYAVNGNPKKFKHKVSLGRIVAEVKQLGNRHVCITGGEPLLQSNVLPLVYELTARGIDVNIETNGGVLIPDTREVRNFSYTLDIKTPCAGAENLEVTEYENLSLLTAKDEVKFVISDRVDYLFAKKVLAKYPTTANIIFSPLFVGKKTTIANDLSNWLIEDKIYKARIGVQIHKILGVE